MEFADERHAVGVGQAHVEERELEVLLPEMLPGDVPGFRLGHGVAILLQALAQGPANHFFVINDEY